MSARDFDVVVIGARCAGAPLATFLAREGVRVLVVDRAPLPSDQVLSTHTIHPPGFDVLEELGVGEAVLSAVRPARCARLVKGDAAVDVCFDEGRIEVCPRRERLDGLLQDAAREAGAELRDRTRATEVVFEGERAVGVRLEAGGSTTDVRADLVVGADGRHSTVAGEVGAEEYLAYDAPRAIYWTYWDAPSEWWSDAYPFDLYLAARGDDFRWLFQTDDDRILTGSNPAADRVESWREDPLGSLVENLGRDPVTGPLVRGREPVTKVRGTIRERYFFRRAAGPGWALVGDAGHHKDYIIGDGITEALLQARGLAAAILEGTDLALERWWRARDVEALGPYFWGRDEGTPEPPGPLTQAVFRRIAADPDLARRMTRLPEHDASPYDLLPPGPVLRALAGCLLRGQLGALGEFLAQGRRAKEFGAELARRRALLDEAAAAA
ncbi:MAG TPA: NAD(P)/FAD-dependent oxidoreductase [Gemmatimonadota bacterium]|nr:NAD(P)/FAD-dependent oxidoreductase [Gemmatimonadota bacterium]